MRDPDPRRGRERYRQGIENHLAFALGYLLLAIQQAPRLGIASAPLAGAIRVGGQPSGEW